MAVESKKSMDTNLEPVNPCDASCARRSGVMASWGGVPPKRSSTPTSMSIRTSIILRSGANVISPTFPTFTPRAFTGAPTSSPVTGSLKYVW